MCCQFVRTWLCFKRSRGSVQKHASALKITSAKIREWIGSTGYRVPCFINSAGYLMNGTILHSLGSLLSYTPFSVDGANSNGLGFIVPVDWMTLVSRGGFKVSTISYEKKNSKILLRSVYSRVRASRFLLIEKHRRNLEAVQYGRILYSLNLNVTHRYSQI